MAETISPRPKRNAAYETKAGTSMNVGLAPVTLAFATTTYTVVTDHVMTELMTLASGKSIEGVASFETMPLAEETEFDTPL